MGTRTKWTVELDAQLAELASDGLSVAEAAKIMGLTYGSVAGRASSQRVAFYGHENMGLRAFIQRGGHLMREDIGGIVGIRWAPADRNGGSFPTPFCERLLSLGLLKQAGFGPRVFRGADH